MRTIAAPTASGASLTGFAIIGITMISIAGRPPPPAPGRVGQRSWRSRHFAILRSTHALHGARRTILRGMQRRCQTSAARRPFQNSFARKKWSEAPDIAKEDIGKKPARFPENIFWKIGRGWGGWRIELIKGPRAQSRNSGIGWR
jgi:hypothetical protein